jgi:hypothetical protein
MVQLICFTNVSLVESQDSQMTINGHVENGKIVLDDAVPLAEGMRVRVELLGSAAEQPAEESIPTLNERYKSFIGIVDDLPPDFARDHDHYLHGHPKK